MAKKREKKLQHNRARVKSKSGSSKNRRRRERGNEKSCRTKWKLRDCGCVTSEINSFFFVAFFYLLVVRRIKWTKKNIMPNARAHTHARIKQMKSKRKKNAKKASRQFLEIARIAFASTDFSSKSMRQFCRSCSRSIGQITNMCFGIRYTFICLHSRR